MSYGITGRRYFKPPRIISHRGEVDRKWQWAHAGLKTCFCPMQGGPGDGVAQLTASHRNQDPIRQNFNEPDSTAAEQSFAPLGPAGHYDGKTVTNLTNIAEAGTNGRIISVTDFPMTVMVFCRTDPFPVITDATSLWSIADTNSNNDWYVLGVKSNGWRWSAQGSGGARDVTTTLELNTNPHIVVGMERTNSDREIWMDGVSAVSSTLSESQPVGMDREAIGALWRMTDTNEADDLDVYLCYVWDRILYDSEIKALAMDPYGPIRPSSSMERRGSVLEAVAQFVRDPVTRGVVPFAR